MLSKWKPRKIFSCLGVAVLAAATINGCGKEKAGTYDMKTQDIFANGCLNVGNLYASLHSMPGDGVIRAFTYDFTTAKEDENGNSPSSSRLRVLNRAAYFFAEGRASELQNTWTSATQEGCSSGALFDVHGNSTPFTVEEYQDTWIKVKLPDDTTQKFDLTSQRSLRIYADEFRGSQCISHGALRTQTETVLRWGPASELSEGETVSARYMRELSNSVAEAPAALRARVNEVTTDSLTLSASVLRAMNDMKVNPRDQRECTAGSKPPTAPDLPTPTPSATPEATPVPEATPEATPAPEASPTPEI